MSEERELSLDKTAWIDHVDRLRKMGFDPDKNTRVYEPDFTVGDVANALAQATYSVPPTLTFNMYGILISIVIESAKAIWVDAEEVLPNQVTPYREVPDWYAEGWFQDRGNRIRAYLVAHKSGDGKLEWAFVQFLPRGSC